MGHDHYQQSSSSGATVAVVIAVMLFVVLAMFAAAGVGLFWVRSSAMQAHAVASEQRAIVAVHHAEAEAQQAIVAVHQAEAEAQRAVAQVRIRDGVVQVQHSRVVTTPATKLNLDVTLDRDGNARIDGEKIGLDDLRKKLVKLKDETSNTFVVHVNADSECQVKHLIPVLGVCEEVGDIDFRVTSPSGSDSSPDEGDPS
jgi:biopolymer transport protein ExbD